MLHDSFRDYFAALGFHRFKRDLPDIVSQDWKDTLIFYCEKNGVSFELSMKVITDNLILAIKLSELEQYNGLITDIEKIQTLLELLIKHHVSDKAFQVWNFNNVKIIMYYGKQHLYVALIQGEKAKIFYDTRNFIKASNQAILLISIPKDSGPLKIIAKIWFSLINQDNWEEKHELPRRILNDRSELAKEILSFFKRRNFYLEKITQYLAPSISKRIIDNVGWFGLDGRILQSVERRGEIVHPLVYKYTEDSMQILDSQEKADIPEWNYWIHTTAEYFLEGDEISSPVNGPYYITT